MNEIKKSVIVPHTPQRIFEIVSDIEHYPNYLPWCSKSEIRRENENVVIGSVFIEYLKIKTHFVTKNINTPYSKIDMELVEGPFKFMQGSWQFTPLGENGCKIDFVLKYKFTNSIIERVIGPVFNYITKNIVDSFILYANKTK
ncbi:MAG: type II toxin-antitoxin system RatA family toxin [Neisseriaceae bacterium]